MQVETIISTAALQTEFKGKGLPDAQIVFYFLSPKYPAPVLYLGALRKAYPSARLVGCTTGGEIFNEEAFENSAVSVAMQFRHSRIKIAEGTIDTHQGSFAAGEALARALMAEDLRLIYILSDGLRVSGSHLVQGLMAGTAHAPHITIAGGLAGDGADFHETGVGIDDLPKSGHIVAIRFGPERVITKSTGNIVYELDGVSALGLYKKYLGEDAEKLPGSALLFPLSIRPPDEKAHSIVRTPLGIDEKSQSLIFSDEIPQGFVAQMMHGSLHDMVDGAAQAASHAPAVALLVSCIGRNLMMGQRVSSEIGAVKNTLGNIPLAGFYSYGEICPHPVTQKCDLHNQTMTITLLRERP